MDVLRIVQGVLGSVQTLINLLRSQKTVSVELKNGLRFIKEELRLIKWDIQKCEDLQLQLHLQELAYDIDDFIHGLWIPGPYTDYILQAVAMNPGPHDIVRIKSFGERIKSLKERLGKSSEATQSGASATPSPSSSAGSPPCYAPEKDLVGITAPKKEIVELLSQPDGPLRVISIVGCSGLGKTALARALYDDPAVTDEFDGTAWVVASNHSPADILNKILQQVDLAAASGSTSEAVLHFPKKKRYLVFVDDVRREGIPWEEIERAFLENDMGSRIIVTTSVPSVARACSSGSYLYTMQRLDQPNSRELFLRKVRRKVRGNPKADVHLHDDYPESIIDICDGLPLALISAANYLRGKGPDPTREDCERVSQALGDCLAGKRDGFEEMRRALVQCYDNLRDHGHMNCLLYFSIFPRGHQINSKSLVRRLIAEGLIPGDAHIMKAQELVVGDVCECLEKLIDQSIIEPAPSRNDSKVAKRCQVHSIMLEFTIKKSVSKNFLSLIHKDKPLLNTDGSVRRLTVQSSPKVARSGLPEEIGLSAVRSLTIFNSGILDLRKCKMMRVLDLEGCRGLDKKVLDDLCGLVFLKYLSLRNTDIHELPGKVQELKLLETLDIRETRVAILPVEVIMMPHLTYLFGKFELTDEPRKYAKKLTEFFSKKSKLHTLAGAVENTQVLAIVVQHARSLKKVKVWRKDIPSLKKRSAPSGRGSLWPKFARLPMGIRKSSGSSDPSSSTPDPAPNTCTSSLATSFQLKSLSTDSSLADILAFSLQLESLSIDSSGLCQEFLGSLQACCTISSIKLRGKLESLPHPDTLIELSNLTKLHLVLTGLSSEALASLQNLHRLKYLKLSEGSNGFRGTDFHVKVDGFPSLVELCFQASKHPRVRIEQGAMTRLASLQLLCQESPQRGKATKIESRLGVEGISHLAQLNEVILHHSAPDATMEAWKEAAKRHINRPYIKKHPNPNSDTT